jgi:hypothetical protein
VLQDCNLSTGEAEEEELQVLGQPGLQRNIQSLKTKQNKKTSEYISLAIDFSLLRK